MTELNPQDTIVELSDEQLKSVHGGMVDLGDPSKRSPWINLIFSITAPASA